MQYRILGHSGITVSEICLGTMTWGTQNTESDAFEQLDYAIGKGINFIDTAELYATPPTPETYGSTETIIGHWLQKTKLREKVVIASKAAGRTPHPKPVSSAPASHIDKGLYWIRGGKARHDRNNLTEALDGSLKRLSTDYIDLYYLHWPDRPAQRFGLREFINLPDDMAPDGDYEELMLDILHTMYDLIKAGKIKSWGLSNETAWGIMKYVQLAERYHLPKPTALQNPYNLLTRQDETSLTEICTREDIAYLPYSPLAAGVLSGKYLNGNLPENARITRSGGRGRYMKPKCEEAVKNYVALANKHDLDPAQMALAFVNQQGFVTSNIIGATTMEQLKADIASADLRFDAAVFKSIHEIHELNPNPGV